MRTARGFEPVGLQLPVAVACQSPAIRNMIGTGNCLKFLFSSVHQRCLPAGPFRESLEGRVVFPTIRAEILEEVVAFLIRAWRKEAYRPRLQSAGRLVDLAMAAHYLDLPALLRRAAKGVATCFAGGWCNFHARWCMRVLAVLTLSRAQRFRRLRPSRTSW